MIVECAAKRHFSITAAVLATAALLVTGFASTAEIAYKNGAWQWDDGSWEGGARPGPADTALIPELPILKARFDSGRMQSNGLTQNEEIQTLRFADLYGISVQGGYRLTLNSIVCDDMFPTPEDTAQTATNRVAMTTLALKGAEAEFYVGTNHVLRLDATTLEKADEGVTIVKTGSGTVLHAGQTWNPTNTFWVKEGTYVRSGVGYPEFRSDVVVGGVGKDAVLTVLPSASQTLMLSASALDIRAKGRVELPALGKYYYQETLKIDHGVLDGGGDTAFCMSNQGSTECGTEYTLDGGTLTNGTLVVVWQGLLTIVPADIPSAIYGSLTFNTGYDIDVPDGTAPVDFLVSGNVAGGNRGIHKAGAGTMLIRCEDHIDTWGGTAGRPFEIKKGALFIESGDDGIGMGTNNVVVAAGATYGGVGRHVGAPVNLRGLWGNVTLNGADGNRAVFVPGRIDPATGAIAPGTYHMGNTEQTNNVISTGYAELRCRVDATGASCLAVDGRLELSATDRLAIVGPAKIRPGAYTLATFTNGFANRFADVTVNGVDIDSAKGSIAYRDASGERIVATSYDGAGSIVFTMPEMATVVLFR
jgi:hypothetical protein